jgi:hypothetical protein
MKIKKYNTKPDNSIIFNRVSGTIHYIDSYEINIQNIEDYSIDYLTALFFTSVPKWVTLLSTARDLLVKPFGLQTGLISKQEELDESMHYNCGDRAIYFVVTDRSDVEIVIAEDDKHLYFKTSVFLQKGDNSETQSLFVTTIVQFHNIWGRVYFAPIKPFHQLIVKRLLMKFTKRLKSIGS